MAGKTLAMISAVALAGLPAMAGAQETVEQGGIESGPSQTGGASYGDQNRGGSRGFYAYPNRRSVDRDSGTTLDRRALSELSASTSPRDDNTHGSAYYGRDYGAPYFGGGYYDGGVYYRDRRD